MECSGGSLSFYSDLIFSVECWIYGYVVQGNTNYIKPLIAIQSATVQYPNYLFKEFSLQDKTWM